MSCKPGPHYLPKSQPTEHGVHRVCLIMMGHATMLQHGTVHHAMQTLLSKTVKSGVSTVIELLDSAKGVRFGGGSRIR